jgi:hypothetical protein
LFLLNLNYAIGTLSTLEHFQGSAGIMPIPLLMRGTFLFQRNFILNGGITIADMAW